MEILILSKKTWRIFGFYVDEKCSKSSSLCGYIVNFFIISILFLATNLCIKYWIVYDEKSIEEKLFLILEIVLFFIGIVPYVSMVWQKKKLAKLVVIFQNIVNERFNDATMTIYENAEAKARHSNIWPMILFFGIYTVIFPTINILKLFIEYIQHRMACTDLYNILLFW